jgi:branched-chain amino acid transport system substrate-binding protein
MRRLVSCLALAAFAVTGCTSGGDDERSAERFTPAAAPAVEVPLLQGLSGPVTVGVVVTGAGARGEGAEFSAPAAGARVAEFRLDQPDTNRLDLRVVDDGGTAEGAVAATRQLVDAGVAGIVYASAGAHLDPALAVAAEARTAVLLPYDSRDAAAGDTTWRTGPSDSQVATRIGALLAGRGQRAPLVLTGEGTGTALAGLADPAHRGTIVAGDQLAGEVATVAGALTGNPVDGTPPTADAVVVAASATTSAEVVAALQGAAPTVPVVLGPAVLAPAFSARLTELGATGGATTAGQFFTVGPAAADSSTTEGIVRFLAAVRLAAQDSDLPALVGGAAFPEAGAATADVSSHDAVLAIAAAATEAGSAEPSAVLGALRGLTVDAKSGLAGPALSFGRPQALGDDGVVVLQATTRGPARNVPEEAPALSWFVVPDGAS